jgi:PhnB protein
MNAILQFDFLIDKENKTIKVTREFDAPLELVWNAWTQAEILDQWWAPLPYRNETISMNFIKGGMWHYAMISPENEKHYCKAYYQNIEHLNTFSYKDAFCNDKGEDLTEMLAMNWTNTFTANNNISTVSVLINFDTIEQLENIIKMGFKEGFTMGLNQLDNLLATIKKQ